MQARPVAADHDRVVQQRAREADGEEAADDHR